MDMFGKKVGAEERSSLEMAEAARQTEWKPSFIRELFMGRFLWDLVNPYPEQTEEDKKKGDQILAEFETLLRENLNPEDADLTGKLPPEFIQKLFKFGAFAMKIPTEHGGLGLSKVNYGRAMHLVASYCGATSVLLSAHQSIGVPQPLIDFGTDEQKKKYLPKFREGWISGFALTEPQAGSDPRRMSTTATPVEDGKFYLLNGEKLWCTNGPIADVLVVMAITPPKVIKGKEIKQITSFIVETKTPGFEVLHRCEFMGIHASQIGLLKFTNVKIPKENMLGREGEGLKLALQTLNTGRLTMPAAVTGASKWAMKVARLWSKKRTQWGLPIGEHEAIAGKLAQIASTVLAMEAVTWFVTHKADQKNTDFRIEAAMSKKFCTESCWKVIDETLQIRGGRGYETSRSLRQRGEAADAYPVERALRDCRINTIIEGTSEIVSLFITREALDSHLSRMGALFNPKSSLMDKLKAIFSAGIFYAGWYPLLWAPVFKQDFGMPAKLNAHVLAVKKSTRRLARIIFLQMMIHRQGLAAKEALMTRLVEIATDIFAVSVTCAYATSKIKNGVAAEDAISLADLFCRSAGERIRTKFHEISHNEDRLKKAVSKKLLDEKFTWLENDIMK